MKMPIKLNAVDHKKQGKWDRERLGGQEERDRKTRKESERETEIDRQRERERGCLRTETVLSQSSPVLPMCTA